MRKLNLLLFITVTGLCGTGHAQTSSRLTTDHNAYRAGDQIVKQQVEYKDPGSSGRNLTWDFSMLQPINEEYTLDYFIPDSSRMDTICGMEHRTRYYYRQSNDSLWAVGFENATTMMCYITPELKMKYPLSYGDTLFSRFEGKGEYSHRLDLTVKGYTRTEADAEGELKLPEFETVKKALRVHTQRYYTETGKDSLEMTLDTYSWYADGVRYPVFESVKTNLIKRLVKKGEQAMDTTVFNTSFYYPPEKQVSKYETTTTPDEQINPLYQVFTEASFMPNPVVSDLLISYKLTREANVWFTLHSSGGIPLRSTPAHKQPEGYNNTTIDMRNLIPGTYALYVHVDDMMVKQVIVKK